jgi:hypothetical protein
MHGENALPHQATFPAWPSPGSTLFPLILSRLPPNEISRLVLIQHYCQ